MSNTIYYAGKNNGDGSIGVEFFESQECIDLLMETDPEAYGGCEGGGFFTTYSGVSDICVVTLDEVKERIKEREGGID
jgi:hypothetical protein